MTRMVLLISAACLLVIMGCGKVKESASQGSACNEGVGPVCDKAQEVKYVPEGLMSRNWSAYQVSIEQGQPVAASKYFDSYEYLDNDYPAAGQYDTWTKPNAKRAVKDPFYTLADLVFAPFAYAYDRCRQTDDPNEIK
ncbi:MAG: hypothetical protein JW745_05900 [Sedimentisphaerales bacterium]|nr:hypothetical protein [Sedimentisphaerales bacterium]MBN2841988.1 hypothetical protein [Sedimentisphaerales bacterium]